MPSTQAATVFIAMGLTGSLVTAYPVWPRADEVRPGVVIDAIEIANVQQYHLSRAEQRMLGRALYRSATVVQRGAVRA